MSLYFSDHCCTLALMKSEADIQAFLEAFGDQVKALRKTRKLTQLDLASLVDMDVRQIQRIEYGEINTSLGNAYQIADGFGVSLSDLFDFEESEQASE